MAKDKEIIIRVDKEMIKKLNELGISVQEVFSKGLYELLREKYEQYIASYEDFDEFTAEEDFIDFIESNSKSKDINIYDKDFDNN
jgi:hypothetical protein